jgi:sec-independent protein translocase protein TatA
MISDITDFLILIFVAILLFSGDPNVKETARTIGKALGELKKRQNELQQQLKKEIFEQVEEPLKESGEEVLRSANTNLYIKPIYYVEDEKIRILEAKIKQLEEELERLRNEKGGASKREGGI